MMIATTLVDRLGGSFGEPRGIVCFLVVLALGVGVAWWLGGRHR
jgi:hypothetical protein